MEAINKKKPLIFTAIGVFVLMGIYFGYQAWVYVSTDNAYVEGHSVMISFRVSGVVNKVLVEENQSVKKGDVLAEIDDQDFANAASKAEADAHSMEAKAADAEANYKRISDLFHKQAVSRQQFDDANSNFRQTAENLKAAKSQWDQAQLNLSYTKLLAPYDGIIAKKSIEVGQFVSPGQALFGFVGTEERWVTANFKETDLDRIHPGRKALIAIDALDGKEFKGEVESISGSTGAVFTLLPPDNATGNFTKVVQRVPVRIKFNNLSPKDRLRLQAGLSAVVSVKVR